MPVDDLGDAVDVLLEFPDQAALADPTLADDRDQPRAALGAGGEVEVLEHPQLRAAPDERRLELLVPPRPAATGDHPQRAVGGHGRGLPLEQLLARGLERDGLRGGVVGRLADEHGPGGATDWRRDAVLTRSPATSPWLEAPSVTAASPVSTPARRVSSAPID